MEVLLLPLQSKILFGCFIRQPLIFWKSFSNVTKRVFFHLRNIAKLRNMLSVSDAEKLVHALMTCRLDYCNALLGGCPASSINKLQIVQNAAARVLTRSRKYDHITPILQNMRCSSSTDTRDVKHSCCWSRKSNTDGLFNHTSLFLLQIFK